MGMNDNIICRFPMFTVDTVFQTKDLKCMLDTYEIDTDGKLYRILDYGLYGNPEEKELECHDFIPYHGYLRFYGDKEGKFIEYNAKFIDGVCISITEIKT